MTEPCKSVSDLSRRIVGDDGFQRELDKDISDRRLAKVLLTIRAVAGKTQAELAESLGKSQSSISKLEAATVDGIRVSDLVGYARTLGLQLSICFEHKPTSAVESIKHHAFEIQRLLDRLVEVAGDDRDLTRGVAHFHVETLVSLAQLVASSATTPPAEGLEDSTVFHVCCPATDAEHASASPEEAAAAV